MCTKQRKLLKIEVLVQDGMNSGNKIVQLLRKKSKRYTNLYNIWIHNSIEYIPSNINVHRLLSVDININIHFL